MTKLIGFTSEDVEAAADGDMTHRESLAEGAGEEPSAGAVTTPLEVTPADEAFLAESAHDIRLHLKLFAYEPPVRLLAKANERVGAALKAMEFHGAFVANEEQCWAGVELRRAGGSGRAAMAAPDSFL
jgi:hypothetical protein